MTKHILTLGLNDQFTYKQHTPTKKAIKQTHKILEEYLDGYTTYITKGGYKHANKKFVRETSIRIELLFTTDIQVQIIANRLKKHFNQESIAHEKITTNSELI
jgi:hypothetical protein